MKSVLLLFVSLTLACSSQAQAFTKAQLDSANTCATNAALSKEEKNVILYINLARLYPKQFAKVYVAKYDIKATGFDYGKAYETDRAALIKRLNETKPMQALVFSQDLEDLATCWAKESGTLGKVGHNRVKCPASYNGECCSYGFQKGIDIVMQLLVDYNVQGYGHRELLLAPRFKEVGVKNGAHKTYKFTSVIDLK